MNIWALDKDIRIKHLLLLLTERLSPHCFLISETPQLTSMAIRLLKPDEPGVTAYLYTYGQPVEHYGVHLEYPRLEETDINLTLEVQENIDFEKLVDVLLVHFDVIPETG